jgi:soluble lytic murein transglycosylase-like protein
LINKIKDLAVLVTVFFILFYAIHDFMLILPVPVFVSDKDPVVQNAENVLAAAGADKNKIPLLSKSVANASKVTGFSPALLTALMKTESEFKREAVSSKGYKGEMQTVWASEYSEVNILLGAKVLETKYRIAGGDLLRALTLYKGGDNPVAKRYAQKTMSLYQNLARL